MGNAAIDYDKQIELDNARNADRLNAAELNVPKNNDQLKNSTADGYEDVNESHEDRLAKSRAVNPIDRNDFYSTIRHKADTEEQDLPDAFREKLDEIRNDYRDAKQLGGEAKTLIKSVTPWGFFSLISKIHLLTDMPYFIAIGAAILKDGLDLIGIGSLPVIGTVLTSCDSLLTMAMMFLGNVMHKEHDRTIFQSILLKQFGVLIFTTIVEFTFGLNLAPFKTTGVLFIFAFALAARKGREKVVDKNY